MLWPRFCPHRSNVGPRCARNADLQQMRRVISKMTDSLLIDSGQLPKNGTPPRQRQKCNNHFLKDRMRPRRWAPPAGSSVPPRLPLSMLCARCHARVCVCVHAEMCELGSSSAPMSRCERIKAGVPGPGAPLRLHEMWWLQTLKTSCH